MTIPLKSQSEMRIWSSYIFEAFNSGTVGYRELRSAFPKRTHQFMVGGRMSDFRMVTVDSHRSVPVATSARALQTDQLLEGQPSLYDG